MATAKKTTARKTTTTRSKQRAPKNAASTSANGRTARTGGASKSGARSSARTSARSNGASASRNGSSSSPSTARRATSNGSGDRLKSLGGDVLHVVERGAKPALAIGATAAGIAGGIALRRRQHTVLGVPVPRSKDSIDIVAISRAVGRASLQLGQTAKNLSKDIDHAADRAERIGKILS